MSGWGEAPPTASDRGQVHRSIWDHDSQDQYEDEDAEREAREEEARDSWGRPGPWGEQEAEEEQQQQPRQRGKGPGSRGGRPAAFDHAQQSRQYFGRYDVNKVHHPLQTAKRKAEQQHESRRYSINNGQWERKRKKKGPGLFSKEFWF